MTKVVSSRRVFVRGPGFDPIDADIDFSNNPETGEGRDTILQELAKKYNTNDNIHFALVGVRSVYSIKSALQDNAKKSKIVNAYLEKYPEVAKIASQIVGVTSNFGVHAGGVVISDKHYPLNKYVPLQRSNSGIPSTLWDKDELQDICGFVKYDLLGVTALSQITAVKYLLNDRDVYKDYPIESKPFSLCKKGHHKNIFQFESPLGKRAFTELKMASIQDLSNASGMIRQMGTVGGRAMYDKYKTLSNAKEKEIIETLKAETSEESFKIIYPILKPTYGVLIYQEQLSSMIQMLSKGKYSFGDGNSVRKKLGKFVTKYGLIDDIQNKPETLKAWHNEIMEILNKYLIPFLQKEDLDSDGEAFINFKLDKKGNLPLPKKGILNWFIIGSTYLFSIIHSVAYSVTSYNQLYQKYNHPVEFWLGALNSNSKDDVANYASSAIAESGITFLPPDINKSDFLFKKEDEKSIRFGLGFIMGLDKGAQDIIAERKLNGEFSDFNDFLKRIKGKRSVNKKVIENLIFGNAIPWKTIEENYSEWMLSKNETNILIWNDAENQKRELEVLNFNISFSSFSKTVLKNVIGLDEIPDNSFGDIAFQVITITNKKTKQGKPYRLLSVVCGKTMVKISVFLWENGLTIHEGSSYKARLSKKGDFISWN
jgi:DNA polymerase III alpha subunit